MLHWAPAESVLEPTLPPRLRAEQTSNLPARRLCDVRRRPRTLAALVAAALTPRPLHLRRDFFHLPHQPQRVPAVDLLDISRRVAFL